MTINRVGDWDEDESNLENNYLFQSDNLVTIAY